MIANPWGNAVDMLYHLYDLQHAMMSPSRAFAETLQHLFSHPLLPISYTRLGRAIAAGSELFERSTRRYKKPEFGLDSTVIDGEPVGVELLTVARKPFCDLLHFKRDTTRNDPKVLLVAPLSGHHATLLRGTAQALLPDHDVYVTDWINACEVPTERGRFDLDDYIDYVIGFLQKLGPDVHVIAVCQPSVPVLAAVALMADMQGSGGAALDDPDGRPDRHPRQPDPGQPARRRALDRMVRAQRHHPGPRDLSGLHAPRLSRLPAADRIHDDEPRPPFRLGDAPLPAPRARRRRECGRPPPLLRRVPVGDGPDRRVLPADRQDRLPGPRAAARHDALARPQGRPGARSARRR